MDVLKVLGPDVLPLRERKPPWFKVPAPGRRALPRAERADPRREPPHGLPGGRLPEHRRVLGARHRDVHDPRRHVHPALRLLQRQDRQADVERPARARPRRALRRADGPAPRGHHERRPRRPARLRRARPSSASSARSAARRRAARSRSSRPTSAARRCRSRRSSPSAPTSSTTTSRSSRACTRSPAAARSSCARCRVLRNAKEMGGDEVTTKSGLMVGLGETHDEIVETFGVLREHGVQVLTVGQYLRPTEQPPARRPLLAPGRVQGARARRLRARLRPHRRRPARALELPRRRARAPARARHRPARRAGSPGRLDSRDPQAAAYLAVFPLKDNIPTRAHARSSRSR